MFNSNNVPLSVSDDDSEELDRLRVRVRRKRKKQQLGLQLKQRLIKYLVNYWMVLIILPALVLFVFEASRIRQKPLELKSGSNPVHESNKISTGILDKLEPVTRVVRGVKRRCLKILLPEEIGRLEIPSRREFGGPVKNAVYAMESGMQGLRGNATFLRQGTGATRFNLFSGLQSFDQRERSFKVNETVNVHCGFYSKIGGFRISDDDKRYMENCKIVVSTCAFGGGDDLYEPIGFSEDSLKKVCCVAFWDKITVAAQESVGRRIGEDNFIGKWRIVVVNDLPFSDQRLNGKIPKMLAHRLFPNSKYSIWVDSKSQFKRDPVGVLEALLWRTHSVLAISEHGARSSVYDEAKAVVKKHKATPEEVEVQLTQYRKDGLPENKRFNGKKALNEASVIVREHTPLTNLFMCLWFNEVVRFTSRDQLSFPYVLWRLKVLKNVNMFPVCVRKDLVNSMGHIRKAKPLII